jgi:hypothetical protein
MEVPILNKRSPKTNIVQRVRVAQARPNCTHITMDMTYQDSPCDICGQFSPLGWLYQCHQDQDQEVSVKCENERLNANPSDSVLVAELKLLGFSPSIIKQAVSGAYTEAQLILLKAQKSNVQLVIQKQMSRPSDPVDGKEKDEPTSIHPNITIRKSGQNHMKRRQLFSIPTPAVKCTLKCCHVS